MVDTASNVASSNTCVPCMVMWAVFAGFFPKSRRGFWGYNGTKTPLLLEVSDFGPHHVKYRVSGREAI